MKKKVGKEAHPTEKSVEMYKWLIERYCPAEGTILDPTAGSFNSCLAAVELDRNAIGIEKDEGFYKKAVKKFGEIFEGVTTSK
jgi:site-specific DNA-methyltransferase (adenine-specific)